MEFPQWECVHRASFPVLSLGIHLLGAFFLPHCPLASDSEVRPGQLMGRGTTEGVPKARQGSEGRSSRVPGAPPALSLGQASSCSQTLRHQHRHHSFSSHPAASPAALQESADSELNPSLPVPPPTWRGVVRLFTGSHLAPPLLQLADPLPCPS